MSGWAGEEPLAQRGCAQRRAAAVLRHQRAELLHCPVRRVARARRAVPGAAPSLAYVLCLLCRVCRRSASSRVLEPLSLRLCLSEGTLGRAGCVVACAGAAHRAAQECDHELAGTDGEEVGGSHTVSCVTSEVLGLQQRCGWLLLMLCLNYHHC